MLRTPDLWAFWTWCLLKASHKEHTQIVGYQEVILKPGQFVFGRVAAADELGLTERKIRTCLKALKKMGNVTSKVTSKFSVLTVVEWASYQSDASEVTSKVTSKRPASDQQVTTNKNVKNEKNTPTTLPGQGDMFTGEEETEPPGPDIYERIFEHWLAQGNLVKSPKLTDAMRSRINGKLKDGFTEDDICKAITNYSKVIASPAHYWSHKWNMPTWLGRENGFTSFTDEADPLTNYRNKEDSTTTKQPRRRRKEMAQRTICPVGHIYDAAEHSECPDCKRMKDWY